MGPLQREYVLRLLRSSVFTRQLAGVKLLRELVHNTFAVYQTQGQPNSVQVGFRGRKQGPARAGSRAAEGKLRGILSAALCR